MSVATQPQAESRTPYSLYVRGTLAVVVADPSFDEEQRLKRRGFEEVLYDARSAEFAYEYARENYGAFGAGVRPCRHCLLEDIKPPAVGERVRGHVWSVAHGRRIIFNGYLCDQHARSLEPGWRFV